ncbi:MAG: PQQ-binding-like beta-propeller repeat protein [Fuerstiella sp.]|nr:PQQ-binding-like beta-propeller repeat protein [Fuerstiella sp.]MCP4854614.1 PQQ-binding-like beta-propeller repeat protein [Fuerstiella sp.]
MLRVVRFQPVIRLYKHVRHVQTAFVCGGLLILSACYASADARKEQHTGSLHGPTDFLQQNLLQSAEDARLLATAERNLRSGDSDAAFVALLQIFARSHDAFTPIFSEKPSHSTYRSALALLQNVDFPTRAAWTRATEALAAQALRNATVQGSTEEFPKVSQRFPFTRAGMEAMALRTTLAISRGQNQLACSLVREMEDHAATAVSFPTEDLLRQLRHQVEAHVANLTAPSNTVSAVGRADVPGELTLPWPEPLWTWQESVWSNPGAATTLAGLLQPEHRSKLSANLWRPVITPDAVILRTPFRIVSFRRDTGDIDWYLPTDTVPEDVRLEDTERFSMSGRGTIAHLLSREELGSMALDDNFLFFIDRFHDFGNRLAPHRLMFGAGGLIPDAPAAADNGRGGTRLVAVQMKPQPHVSWTVGGPNFGYRFHADGDSNDSETRMPAATAPELKSGTTHAQAVDVQSGFQGRRFLGTPLVYDRMLFVLSSDDEMIWLSCLAQATGRTIWNRPLTYENVPIPTRRSRFITPHEESNGVSLCGVQGDTLICAVNSGLVIGTRVIDGQLKWATSVRGADNSPYSLGTGYLPGTSSRPSSGFQPLFHDHRMIWASDHSTMVHCIDTDSGSILWQVSREVTGSGLMEGSRDRYAVAVLPDRVVMVGDRHARALSMSDGRQLWGTPIQEQTGRGTCNAAHCLIPLRNATVMQIDVQTGMSNSVSQTVFAGLSGAAVGTLVADDDIICAATPLSVIVLPTIQAVRKRAAQHDLPTGRERLITAQTQLLSADLEEGVTNLQRLLSDEAVGVEASELLAESLLLMLAENRFQVSTDRESVPAAAEILDRLSLSEEQQIRRFLLGSVHEPSLNRDSSRPPLLSLLPDWQVRADIAAWTALSGDSAPAVAPFLPDDEPRLSFSTIEHAILFPQQLGDVAHQITFAERLVDSHYPTAAHLFLLAAAKTATAADRQLLEHRLPSVRPVLPPAGHTTAQDLESDSDTATRRPTEIMIEESLSLSSGSRLVTLLSMEKGMVETPDWFSDRLFRTSQGVVSVNMDIGAISAPVRLPGTAEIVVPSNELQSPGIVPLSDARHVGVLSLVAADGPSMLWWKRLERDVTDRSAFEIGPIGPGFMIVATGSQLSCLHPFTGRLLWKRAISMGVAHGTAFGGAGRLVGDERVIGVLGENMKSCQVFRTQDGERLDAVRLDIPAGQTPLLSGRMVLFHKDQRLALIDLLTGRDLMESTAPVDIRPPGMAQMLPRGRAVTISNDLDAVVINLQTGHTDIRCSLEDHVKIQRITGLKAFERRNRLFVLIKDWGRPGSRLSNSSRLGATRLESGTLVCIDRKSGEILWSRPAVPSVLAEIHGDPTDLLVTWSWKNPEYPVWQRQIGGLQNNDQSRRSQSGRSLIVTVIDGQTSETLAEKEFFSFASERDEPVRFLHDAASSTISLETVRTNIAITYGH